MLRETESPTEVTEELLNEASSSLLQAPNVEEDLTSPSIAKQRFHRAYKLVTLELRDKLSKRRVPPRTPLSALVPTDAVTPLNPNTPEGKETETATQAPSRNGGMITTSTMDSAGPLPESIISTRPWLKPFRLVSSRLLLPLLIKPHSSPHY